MFAAFFQRAEIYGNQLCKKTKQQQQQQKKNSKTAPGNLKMALNCLCNLIQVS